ncbi:NAD(P)H-dependent flavin oxidoreductase [Azospirillum doebereinerae]|uniref:NAD(P)H-dependent flavin oxidoreductase n=1 Tax=Azospirillum doebereinerae TaxID=92933 RepID=UPI001EE56CF2|nr:nitronate monooxygenase [Azospirillum doebereinerae]MCG5242914.1 nitronate monooxygenase [Azospirillum doebereinerae]
MTRPPVFQRPPLSRPLSLPVIAAPMFRVSYPELVVAQCKAGIIGSFPAANARPEGVLDEWLARIKEELAAHDAAHPDNPAAPFAVNLVVHKSNARLEEDLALCVRHAVPLIITSLGARPDVNTAVHGYGGTVLHDVTTIEHAHKAVERGADGLIAVAAGAGGHAGRINPFALMQEIRAWWRGPLVLSGAIANGRSILAAQVLGADLVYIGSPFIATREAAVEDSYKQAVVATTAGDIVYTDAFSGVNGNYIRASIVNSGLDPDNLEHLRTGGVSFRSSSSGTVKVWRDIWACGQGVGLVEGVVGAAELIGRLKDEYRTAQRSLS